MKTLSKVPPESRWSVFYLIAALAVVAALVAAPQAQAFTNILNDWQAIYGPAGINGDNSQSGNNASCELCHADGDTGLWNQYGSEMEILVNPPNNLDPAVAMVQIENNTSVNIGGGTTYRQEIQASAQPGWTSGNNNTIYNNGGVIDTENLLPPANIGDLDPGVNQPPTANDDSATTAQDTPVNIDVLANDEDPDVGDTLSVASVTQGTNGTVTNNGADVTYSPDPGFFGTDTFTYIATDGTDNSNSATVTVTVTEAGVNTPPTARDDAATTNQDVAINIDVLANDTDPDVGDILSVASVTQGSNGTVSNNGSDVTYAPDPGFFGTDTFTYIATDGTDDSNSATVTVTVIEAPQPPTDCTGIDDLVAEWRAQGNGQLRVSGTGARDGIFILTNAISGDFIDERNGNNGRVNFNVNGNRLNPVPCFVQVDQPDVQLCGQAEVINPPADCAPSGITARGDSYTTVRDDDLTVPATRLSGVLYNDFHISGTPLSVTNVDTTGIQGAVTVNPDGSFTYTPPAGAPTGGAAYLDDTFTYQATDGVRFSPVATVNVRTLPKQTDFKFMMNYELGMHCTGFEFAYCCVLPAYNSIVSQIAKPAIGDPADSPCFGAACAPDDQFEDVAFTDGFPRLLEGDPNLGANLDVLGRETVVRDPELDGNGDFRKYVVKYWHDAQSRNDGQGKPQIGNPALQASLPPHLNTATLVSDVEGNSLLSWNTRADAADRNEDGSFVIGASECTDPADEGTEEGATCAARGVVQGNGDYGDVGNTFVVPVDNYQNAVWNHLYIYSGTEGAQLCADDTTVACFSDADCADAGVGGSCGVSTEINKARLGLDVDYPTNFGPAGHPMGPVSGGVFDDNAFMTFSEDTGTVVYTQMKLVENLPIMLTSPRIWEALGLPLTPFEDTLGFFADPGAVDEDSVRPYVQMSAQLHEAVCDEVSGNCSAGAAVLGAGGHPVQGFGDAPIDIPNCERCHSAPPTDADGNQNDNSPNINPENNALVVLETDFWMAYYDLDPLAGDSDWYARLKGAAISILSIHDFQHGTQFTANFPAVSPIQPASVPFNAATELGGLSDPFPGTGPGSAAAALCIDPATKVPADPAVQCSSHAQCEADVGPGSVCDLPQNTRLGHDSVICQKCHADNVIAVVKSTACGPNAQTCADGALIPALSQALHYNHRNVSEGGFVSFGDALGRDGGCQGCHPAHRSDGVMDGYPIDLDGNNFYASGDNRLASGGCFVGRDVHSNPNKDIDGAETPEHLNVLGQYLADNVFYNQAAEPGGTEDTRGIWCTNCHSQAGQQMWKAENCTDLINNECAPGENPRAAATMQELADALVTRQPDPALRLATLESWADPKDPNVLGAEVLPISTPTNGIVRTADDTHFIWKNDAGLCNYVAQWAAAGFNLSEISAEYDGPVALVEVAVPFLGGSVAKCQTGDALSDTPNGTPVNVCDGAPGIPPGGFFICGSYDTDGDFTAALTAPPGESPFCTTQDCKTAADATLEDGGTTGNVTAQIPFSSSDISTASDGRDHWLSAGEPHCADCHKAPYTEQSGNINPFPPFNYPRRASLMRYSRGHQDVTCQGCHESIHGLYPVTPTIDNTSYAQAAALNNDGSHGPLKCESCHTHVTPTNPQDPTVGGVPTWVAGLPYTDPIDGTTVSVGNNFDRAVSWAHTYTDEADPRADVCQNCHGDLSGGIANSNTEWQIHAMVNRVSRLAMDDAEANNGTVSGIQNPNNPYAGDTVCTACHDNEGNPECEGEDGQEWKQHLTEGRVSEHVWEEVSIATTGTTCGW